MTFIEYLAYKKIDATRFRVAEPGLFQEWEEEFRQMHPDSFTVRKRYKINPLRRKYHLSE